MDNKNYYVSDVFFKLSFGQNTNDSKQLRHFLLRNVVPDILTDNLTVVNPELTPQMIRAKGNILDVHMQSHDLEVDLEMQNSKLSIFLNRRFIHYSCKLIDYQLEVGDTSGKLKELVQIIFIRDVDKRCPKLMDDFYAKNHHHVSQLGYLQTTIYVYLPYINVIASEKAVLSEFEALLYLMENGNLDGIEYEEKEGMIEMMKKKYDKFTGDEKLIKEVDARYQVQYDFQEWHDYDVEYAKNEGLLSDKKVMVKSLIEMTYSKEAPSWIDKCSLKQLDMLFKGIIQEHWKYEELKEKVFMS